MLFSDGEIVRRSLRRAVIGWWGWASGKPHGFRYEDLIYSGDG
jgi:hypothetical protein